MKKLVIVNGTMGVGKSTVVSKLYKQIENSVWLDGDWCWQMNPWHVTEENKAMVMNNIHFILNQYLDNSGFDYIFFTWVVHKESIFEEILSGLKDNSYKLLKITLICSEEELLKRMVKDKRNEKDMENSVNRLACYGTMNTHKLDTTGLEMDEIINELLRIVVDDEWKKPV
ncbi:nucleotide kinase [Paenibacillus sp. PK3_47]|uniref:AAA family ATPase n=1 Tax=Paenibacillus sp. PK3_47 TaxID=2072642 RepID=UPI00201E4A8D|nr:AAA family ATPase [Paenibacillus sp. PK3_47]UQZ37325.1 nucleotide kinase [Paenibacillus sp. PK3_47]